MNAKVSKPNASIEEFSARLDQVTMSGHECLRAKASLARAEAMAELIARAARAVRRLFRIALLRPLRRLASALG